MLAGLHTAALLGELAVGTRLARLPLVGEAALDLEPAQVGLTVVVEDGLAGATPQDHHDVDDLGVVVVPDEAERQAGVAATAVLVLEGRDVLEGAGVHPGEDRPDVEPRVAVVQHERTIGRPHQHVLLLVGVGGVGLRHEHPLGDVRQDEALRYASRDSDHGQGGGIGHERYSFEHEPRG